MITKAHAWGGELNRCTFHAIVGGMSDVQGSSHEEEIERMVKALMGGVEQFGNFDGALGVGAVLTFTNRFLQTILTLSPTAKAREENVGRMTQALRHMAGVLEFEHAELKGMKVH